MKSTLSALTLPTLLLVIAGCSTSARPVDAPEPTPVRVERVTETTEPLPLEVAGVLEPATTIQLAFKVGGPVDRVLFDEGQPVRRGDVVARLVTDEVDAAVTQAQAAFDKATRDVDRLRRLYADSVVTLAQLQDAETGLEMATAGRRAATFNRGYAQIVAPGSGRILKRWVEDHELVSPGQPVVEIGLDGGWVVRAGVADIDLVRVREGDRARVAFDAFPDAFFEAVVTTIGAQADTRSGTFPIEVQLAAPDNRLRTGFLGRVEIFPSGEGPSRVVPASALVRAVGSEGTVFVLDEASGIVHERPVRIDRILDQGIAVSSGLPVGALVITDGAAYVRDGERVRVAAPLP